MIRIAVCDDEREIRDEISGYIDSYAERKNITDIEVAAFDSAGALTSALEDGMSFDVFILDVYVGDDMGTRLARDIRRRGIESSIIFSTSSLEHAPEGYEMGTLRYLVKPLSPAKLYEAMDAALANAERLGRKLIKLKTENGVESVNASHIMCSEAHDHYQHITLQDGGVIKVRLTVSELFALLSKHGGFIRVGSPYVVNLRQVKNLSRTEVVLYNDKTIQIPRGKYTEIKNAFWDYQYEGEDF